jgi:hypothetical protein
MGRPTTEVCLVTGPDFTVEYFFYSHSSSLAYMEIQLNFVSVQIYKQIVILPP